MNEAVRKKEMDDAELKRGQSKLDTKMTEKEAPVVKSNLNDVDDETLREGLIVLSDLIGTKIG